MKLKKRGKANSKILLLVCLLIVISICFAIRQVKLQNDRLSNIGSSPKTNNLPISTLLPVQLSQIYKDRTGFSFKYPGTWNVKTSTKAGNTSIDVVFGEWGVNFVLYESTEDCGGFGPQHGESLNGFVYYPINNSDSLFTRLDFANGRFWTVPDSTEKIIDQPIMFPKLRFYSESIKESTGIVGDAYQFKWCFEDRDKGLQVVPTYYSSWFTRENFDEGAVNMEIVGIMDNIVSSIQFE